MTLPEIQNLSDEELSVRCAESARWKAVRLDVELAHRIHTNPPNYYVGICPVIQSMEHGQDESKDFNYWILPSFERDLNACQKFESILLSEPVPEKGQIGRPSSHLERYEFALVQLEPDKPLWHKSARTKAVAFVFAMQD